MYIAELDRPWTDTPFIFQGFVLQTAQQLEILKEYCKVVYVDPERGQVGAAPLDTIPPRGRSVVDLSRTGKFRWTELASVEDEYSRAAGNHAHANRVMRECVVALRSAKVLPADMLCEAVSRITESVLRNADAMLLFSQLEEKGDYTESHALDCSIYMAAFARFLGMSREDILFVGHLGLLQDIGKLRVPTTLIKKRGRLIPFERSLANAHVEYSAEILHATPGLPRGLAEAALLHHERHDGSGYPRKLRGKEIGLIGSMAAIVDTFDALTARRPYAEPVSPSAALNMLYGTRGTWFDAYLVEQFIRCIGVFPVGSIIELNDGEIGVVIAQNRAKRLLPRVIVMRDGAGNPLNPQKLIDLSRGTTASNGEPYRIKRTHEWGKIPVSAKELFLNV
jgi:HD-GYP domain-containing protein (c-di-GMP phosphodiesterase class II)